MDYEEKAAELLNYLVETLKTAEQFVIEQAPILVQEAYNWFLAENIFVLLIGLFFLGLSFICWKAGKKRDWWTYHGRLDPNIMFLSIPITIGLTIFGVALYDLIYLLIAPRLYLINEISNLL